MSKRHKEVGYKGPVVPNSGTINSRFPKKQAPLSVCKPRTFREGEVVFPKPGSLWGGLEPAAAKWLKRFGVEPSPWAVRFFLAVLAVLIAAGVTSQVVVAAVAHDMSSGHNFPSSGHAHRPGISNPNNAPTLHRALHQLLVTVARKNKRQTAVDAGIRSRVANAEGESRDNSSNGTTRRRHRRRHRRADSAQIASASPANNSLLEGEQATKMTDDSRTSKGDTRIMSSGAQTAIDAPVIPGGEGPKDKWVINPQKGPSRDLFKHMIPLIEPDIGKLPADKPYLYAEEAYGPEEYWLGIQVPIAVDNPRGIAPIQIAFPGILTKHEANNALYAMQVAYLLEQNHMSGEDLTYQDVAQLKLTPDDITRLIDGIFTLQTLASNLEASAKRSRTWYSLPIIPPQFLSAQVRPEAWQVWKDPDQVGAFLAQTAEVLKNELQGMLIRAVPFAIYANEVGAFSGNKTLIRWFQERQEKTLKAHTPGEMLLSLLAMLKQEASVSPNASDVDYAYTWATDRALEEMLQLGSAFNNTLEELIDFMVNNKLFPGTPEHNIIGDLRYRAAWKMARLIERRFQEHLRTAEWPAQDLLPIIEGLTLYRVFAPSEKDRQTLWIPGSPDRPEDLNPRSIGVEDPNWSKLGHFSAPILNSIEAYYSLAYGLLNRDAKSQGPEWQPEYTAQLLYILGTPAVIGLNPNKPVNVHTLFPPGYGSYEDALDLLQKAAWQVFALRQVLLQDSDVQAFVYSQLSDFLPRDELREFLSYAPDHGGRVVARVAEAIEKNKLDLAKLASQDKTTPPGKQDFNLFESLSPTTQAYLLLMLLNTLYQDNLTLFDPVGEVATN